MLKQLIFNAKLSDPYSGGISSYGIILMVVSFLQSKETNS
jgi:non-canonical poly(A) RNA polymerase PAPD5/7